MKNPLLFSKLSLRDKCILKIYKGITYLIYFLVPLCLLYRVATRKEDSARWKERLGWINPKKTPQAKKLKNERLLWIHAVSVGELMSSLPLVQNLNSSLKKSDNSQFKFLITTNTVSSSKLLQDLSFKNGIEICNQFITIDSPIAIKKFLGTWKPDLGIFIDSEIWPNLLTIASEKCKLLLLNARISDNSFKKWKKFRSLLTYILCNFTVIAPCGEYEYSKFEELGPEIKKRLRNFGNLKYINHDVRGLMSNKASSLSLKTGKRPVFLAVSTHKGEEEILLELYQELLREIPNLLIIIAPRHVERGTQTVARIAQSLNIEYSIRSLKDKITERTNLYIADTMGELKSFYAIADVTFIGGSLISHGGHNVIEPLMSKNICITGRYYSNFQDIVKNAQKAGALFVAEDADKIKSIVLKAVKDPVFQKDQVRKVKSFLKTMNCDIQGIVALIDAVLSERSVNSP